MMKQIKPLSISEEMLGAYLEGNLSLEEARYVENLIGEDDDLQTFVGDLTTLDVNNEASVYDECPDFDAAFELPQVEVSKLNMDDTFQMTGDLYSESGLCNDFLSDTFKTSDENMDVAIMIEKYADLNDFDNFENNIETENDSTDNGGWNEEDWNNNLFNDLNYD